MLYQAALCDPARNYCLPTLAHPLLPEDALRAPIEALDFGEALCEIIAVAPATAEPAGSMRDRGPINIAGLPASDPWLAGLTPVAVSIGAAETTMGGDAPVSTVGSGCEGCLSPASLDAPESEPWADASAAAAARVPSLSELLDLLRICKRPSQCCQEPLSRTSEPCFAEATVHDKPAD